MGKHKFLFWSLMGFWVLLLAGGGVFAWHFKQNQHKKVLMADNSSSETGNYNTGGIQDAGNGPQTISGASNAGQNSPQIAGDSTTNQQSDSSMLIDPTTFAQYDSYKDKSSAYFIDLQKGDGAELTSGKKAAVYYKGWLTNGTLFDQSKKGSDGNLQAFVFTQGGHQVIPGWEEGLDGMKVGGVRLLIVPPSVGYGATGQGPIPANAVLIFQVQLAEVQ
jgi:FKBP-type peptidyl-prolyl cis-trans isomerase